MFIMYIYILTKNHPLPLRITHLAPFETIFQHTRAMFHFIYSANTILPVPAKKKQNEMWLYLPYLTYQVTKQKHPNT